MKQLKQKFYVLWTIIEGGDEVNRMQETLAVSKKQATNNVNWLMYGQYYEDGHRDAMVALTEREFQEWKKRNLPPQFTLESVAQCPSCGYPDCHADVACPGCDTITESTIEPPYVPINACA